MGKVFHEFRLYVAIAVLLLLALIALVLGGAFDALSEIQAAFLGTLSGATVGFLGLLAGALYNAGLNREQAAEIERRRAETYTRMLWARARSLATTLGLIARMIDLNGRVSIDNIEQFEAATLDFHFEESSDVRLLDVSLLQDYCDLVSLLGAIHIMSAGPIKTCNTENRVYGVSLEMLKDFQLALVQSCERAIRFRKSLATALSETDVGPSSYDAIVISRPLRIDS